MMQDAVTAFFQNSVEEPSFSVDLFPEWFHPTLEDRRCTLAGDFQAVHGLLHSPGRDQAFRSQVRDQCVVTNRVQDLCEGSEQIPTDVIAWDSDLGKAIKALMDRLYESLDLAVFRSGANGVQPTKEMYSEFINLNKYVCPFCGLGRYKNVLGARREDFDHYLHKSKYPFAAANVKNLVPSCGTCNQDYKGSKDILQDGAAFYPYADVPDISVAVACTTFPSATDLQDKGAWQVSVSLVEPDESTTPKMRAWNRVYQIEKRLSDEVEQFYEEWLEEAFEDAQAAIEQDALRQLLACASTKASNAATRRMQPGQIIRHAFFECVLATADHPFVESFRRAKNAKLARAVC